MFKTIRLSVLGLILMCQCLSINAQKPKKSNEMHPSWSPVDDRIVFYSNKAGNEDIYTISVGSGTRTQLTHNISADSQPTWSPNGELIAFESNRNGDYDIYLIRPDGDGLKRMTFTPNQEMTPSWSPDSKKIVYEAAIQGKWQLFILDIEFGTTSQITTAEKDHLAACWSLDGKSIFYSSSNTGKHQTDVEIHQINLSDQSQKELTRNSGVSSNIALSLIDDRVVFNTQRDGNWEIYSMEKDGSNPVRLTDSGEKLEEFEFADIDGEPSVSSEGKSIAFLSGRDGSFDICIINHDGSGFKNLTKNWRTQ